MIRAVAVLLAVCAAHYLPDATGAAGNAYSWLFYILRGVEGTVLCAALLGTFQGRARYVGALGCWIGIFEEAQTAVCGTLQAGNYWPDTDLCVVEFGPLPYAAIAATVVVAIGWIYARST